MAAVIIYESLTGNTKRAAQLAGAALAERGVEVLAICPTTDIDLAALSAADLVIIGSWVDGIFVVGQRPAREGRLRKLPSIRGKKAVVFCTYALNPGSVLEKMTATIEGLGAEVVGGYAIRRNRLAAGATEFAERVAENVSAGR
jgi:hypothetical protein